MKNMPESHGWPDGKVPAQGGLGSTHNEDSTDSRQRLADILREQGEDEQNVAALTPALRRLEEWRAPTHDLKETQHLLSVLLPLLSGEASGRAQTPAISPAIQPAQVSSSPVREALRQRQVHPRSRLEWFPELALLQGMLVRPSFWVASAFIVGVGLLAVMLTLPSAGEAVLRAVGPLMSALGVSVAFRSVRLNTLEIELSCPASPLRLLLARLVLVLGYDIFLGLLMSAVLALFKAQAGVGAGAPDLSALVALTTATVMHWLAPLLLVAGVALLLSLRMSAEAASAIAYAGWLTVLAITLGEQPQGLLNSLLSGGEATLAMCGIALLWLAALRLRAAAALLLPRA